MNDRDLDKIKRIKNYCQEIIDFGNRFGKDFSSFNSDNAYKHAVSMCILQIGELANKLSFRFNGK